MISSGQNLTSENDLKSCQMARQVGHMCSDQGV